MKRTSIDEAPPKLDQYAIMAELAADRSTWRDLRAYPSTVICRLLLMLADWAAAEPEKWRASHLRFETGCKASKVAAELALSLPDAKAAIKPQTLCSDEPAAGGCASWPTPPATQTYRRAALLAERASAYPTQWRCWRLRAMGMPQRQVAEILNISQQRVSQMLARPILPRQETLDLHRIESDETGRWRRRIVQKDRKWWKKP